MDNTPDSTGGTAEVRCAECSTLLGAGQDREVTDDGTFCRPCFNNLTAQLQQALAQQGEGINYSMAVVGGLLGAVIGVVVWWGFTVVTSVAFGLVAIVIGFTVGKGVCMLSGHKRHLNLQIMSVVIATISFFYASYLVNRTFIQKAYAEQGQEVLLPLLPSLELFIDVIGAGFGIMDLVFLAIVGYQAWKMPSPVELIT